MEFYASDKEQIEQVKELWKKYGLPLIIGVFIGTVAVFGWRVWQNHKTVVAEQAYVLYSQLLVNPQDETKLKSTVAELISQFPKTPYAAAGALKMAQYAVSQNQIPEAIAQLQWVIVHAKSAALKQVASIRLARIYIAKQRYADAQNSLAMSQEPGFISEVDEVKGDIFYLQGDNRQAKQYYQRAFQALPQGGDNPLLRMKLENVD